MTSSQKLGEKMYAGMQDEQGGAANSAQPEDDDVVDAEVKEVKKD